MKKFRMWIIRLLCGGKLPIDAVSALWILIDEENQKPEDEIRCDFIEAWEEAAERVKIGFKGIVEGKGIWRG